MNPKYKPNDVVYYYLDKWGTVIKTKVKFYTAVGFYFLEDNRVDSLVPEIELFDTEEECIEKTLIWNNAVIDGYKNEINHLVKVNEKLKETLEKHKTYIADYCYYIKDRKVTGIKEMKATKKEITEQIEKEVKANGGFISTLCITFS